MDPFSNPGNDAPPPPASPAPGPSSIPTAAPPVGNVGLGQGKLPESDERTMGMLAHILGGVTNFLGPLIIWLIKKDESPFVNDQGKEALNFQISVALAAVVCFILMVVVIGFPLLVLLGVAALVLTIIAGIKANEGQAYRYPFAWRLLK